VLESDQQQHTKDKIINLRWASLSEQQQNKVISKKNKKYVLKMFIGIYHKINGLLK